MKLSPALSVVCLFSIIPAIVVQAEELSRNSANDTSGIDLPPPKDVHIAQLPAAVPASYEIKSAEKTIASVETAVHVPSSISYRAVPAAIDLSEKPQAQLRYEDFKSSTKSRVLADERIHAYCDDPTPVKNFRSGLDQLKFKIALEIEGRPDANADLDTGALAQLSTRVIRIEEPARKLESINAGYEVRQSQNNIPKAIAPKTLSLEGNPGDVHLVVATCSLITRKRGYVPRLPLPPFTKWNKWLDAHENSSHCTLDWMDASGQWWHTEMKDISECDPAYTVGQGEFPATGLTVYGIMVAPGRTDPGDQTLLQDELIQCDYKILEREAKKYALRNKSSGDPGTNGDGKSNVGLGGPPYKPSQNCNTCINYLLRKAGVEHPMPQNAIGWESKPHFPISTDAP